MNLNTKENCIASLSTHGRWWCLGLRSQQRLNDNEKNDTGGEAKPRCGQNGFVHMTPQRVYLFST